MTSTNEAQEFQFVLCSGKPSKDKQQVTNIKKHVMLDYYRKQASAATTKHTANTKRVRSKPGSEPFESSEVDRLSSASSRLVITDSITRTGRSISPQPPAARLSWSQNAPSVHTTSSPGAHRADPFDCLPVKQIPDDLIEWFSCLYEGDMKDTSWVHKSNVQWAQNIWHSSTQDTALFFTVLSQAERNRMVLTRSTDNRRYLFLRGQALQALRKRISSQSVAHVRSISAHNTDCISRYERKS